MEQETYAPLHKRRLACSLLAFIADVAEAQALLPLILICNEQTITDQESATINEEFSGGSQCWLLRRKSAWVNAQFLIWLMGVLRKCLSSLDRIAQLVLLMDCCPVHATASVLRAAALNGIVVIFIPALMTIVLQPLDVYVFAKLKHRRGRLSKPSSTRRLTTFCLIKRF